MLVIVEELPVWGVIVVVVVRRKARSTKRLVKVGFWGYNSAQGRESLQLRRARLSDSESSGKGRTVP